MLALLTNPAVDKHSPAVRRLAPVRVMHGVASAAIILVFLFPHPGNHVAGILGADTHKSVMLVLRHLYRAGWIEPVLIALFIHDHRLPIAVGRHAALKTSLALSPLDVLGRHGSLKPV
ncbi:hypothetical protein [Paraburkholderia diazotrophica]|nr:hypothetical protein [Paraburkholderia diazotrophica]